MFSHERSCTLNPERECRMCKLSGDAEQLPMHALIAALREGGVAGVRAVTENGCPACILAAIRQDRLQRGIKSVRDLDDEEANAEWNRYPFDFRKEAQDYINEVRSPEATSYAF
jgi:hypothetical protein